MAAEVEVKTEEVNGGSENGCLMSRSVRKGSGSVQADKDRKLECGTAEEG